MGPAKLAVALGGATFAATIALGGARGNVALGGARENFGRFRWGRQHALFARRGVRGTAPLLVASVLALFTVVTHDLSHSHTDPQFHQHKAFREARARSSRRKSDDKKKKQARALSDSNKHV